jgi:hypothetical protein
VAGAVCDAAAVANLDGVFERLAAIMRPYGEKLVVERDLPGDYYVNTPWRRADGYVLMFGAVRTRTRYVSYHLMPVYAAPALLAGMSAGLRRRMQGKACFNFSTLDEELLAELAGVTGRAFEGRDCLRPR